MSENKENLPNSGNAPSSDEQHNAQATQMPLVIHAQFVKDLSFENPNAPDTLVPGQETPEMIVNVGLDLRKINGKKINDGLEDNMYEITLHTEASAKRGDQVVFLAEIDYVVVASVHTPNQAQHHPLLMIEAPKLAFPFVRQIIAEITSNGGFPPLLLSPVDFEGLYIQRYKEQQAQAAEGA